MKSYTDMIDEAMKSDKLAQDWFNYLKNAQTKQTKEREILKTGRVKYPGRTDNEILGYTR